MRVYVGSGSDQGRIKGSNQDAVGVDLANGLFLVADGVGGNAGGDIASGIIVSVAKELVAAANSYEDRKNALVGAVREANARILKRALAENKKGMSSTVTAFLIGAGKYFVVQAGDSRAYLIRGNEIVQVTKDNSHVQQLVDRGIITPEEARHHEDRNVITRAVGLDPEMEIDTYEGEFRETDALLACSDGLWGEMTDKEMLDTVLNSEDGQQACNALIELANRNGGHDNISVILAQSSPTMRKVLPQKAKLRPGRLAPRAPVGKKVLVGGLVVVFLAVAALLLSRVFTPRRPVWVTFETTPETLGVTSARDGFSRAVHSGESIQLSLPITLVFQQAGYSDDTLVINEPGRKKYRIELRSPLARVNFRLPPDAVVRFKKSGVEAREVESLPFGAHPLRCERPGYVPCDTVLQVSSVGPLTFEPVLKASPSEAPAPKPVQEPPKALPSTPIVVIFPKDANNAGAKVILNDELQKGTVPVRVSLTRGKKYTAVLQLSDGRRSKPRVLGDVLTSSKTEVRYPSSAFDFR